MATDWNTLKVAELKEELKKRDLPVTGRKADLVERLEGWETEQKGGESSAEKPASGHISEEEAAPPPADEVAEGVAEVEAAAALPAAEEVEATASPPASEVGEAVTPPPAAEEAEAAAATPAAEEAEAAAATPAAEEAEVAARTPAAEEAEAVTGPAEGVGPITVAPDGEAQGRKRRAPEEAQPAIEPPPKRLDTGVEGVGTLSPPEVTPAADGSLDALSVPGARAAPEAPAATEGAAAEEAAERATGEGATPGAAPGTRALVVRNLVRPFTEAAAKRRFGETGGLEQLWMPTIKTHAYVLFASKEAAGTALAALDGAVWPEASPKVLEVAYVSLREAEDAFKTDDSGFAIARTPEEEEEEKTEVAAAAAAAAAAPAAPASSALAAERTRPAVPIPAIAEPAVGADDGEQHQGDLRSFLTARRASKGAGAGAADEGDPALAPASPGAAPTASPDVDPAAAADGEAPVPTLETLFNYTEAKPRLYWKPAESSASTEPAVEAPAPSQGRDEE